MIHHMWKLRSSVMTQAKFRMLLLILLTCNVGCFLNGTWFNQRVTWKYGTEGLAWKTTVKQPSGQAEYQLALQSTSEVDAITTPASRRPE